MKPWQRWVVVGDEKGQIHKSWTLVGLGRREPQIMAVESRLICQLPVFKTNTVIQRRHMPRGRHRQLSGTKTHTNLNNIYLFTSHFFNKLGRTLP